MKKIVFGDNADVLPTLPEKFARTIYIDPPFNTGKVQKRDRIRVTATDGEGDRGGFGGRRYDVEHVESGSYTDDFDNFEAFLMPRIEASLRCLTADGSRRGSRTGCAVLGRRSEGVPQRGARIANVPTVRCKPRRWLRGLENDPTARSLVLRDGVREREGLRR
jgi:hypothetical protein